ncbi:MAG: hypothetical protein ACFFCW_06340 [Candidatus Hodarchaeota archaeon]
MVYKMNRNGKKTWRDPLVEIANTRKTKAEKKLWGVLRAIARSKHMPPKRIIDGLDRANRKHHFMWTTVPPKLESFISPRELHKVMVDERGRKILYRADDENPEKWLVAHGEDGKPLEAIDEITITTEIPEKNQKYFRPHLGSWGPLSIYDYYLFELIPRLRNPDWVAALRICPGCGKLLMSSAKWENKFCNDRCKKRNWARINRKTRVYCRGEEREITLLECRQTQNDLPYNECQTCTNLIKKGGRKNGSTY